MNRAQELTRPERLDSIERKILDEGTVSIADLAEEFAVSIMTVHRDLDALERRGAIRRLRGAATALSSIVIESDLRYRTHHSIAAKRSIANEAAKLLEPGQAVMLDDSSTAALLAEYIATIGQMTVITNSVALLSGPLADGRVRFLSLGGEYQRRYQAFEGLITERTVSSLSPHFVFMSASAVRGSVAYHPDEGMVRVKRAMLTVGGTHVLLADSQKFGAEALHRIADLSEYEMVITDSGISSEIARELRDRKVNLIIASPS
jgi:DeoR/GlpR family transcriptional regulator of sugar metabolism